MATSAISFRPVIKASSGNNGKADVNQRRNQVSASASSPNWWTPLFGWNSKPDYIDNSSSSSETSGSGGKFMPGCFTEEKAKQLRIKAMESANFHDIMYHSAIASRLASDVPIRNDL